MYSVNNRCSRALKSSHWKLILQFWYVTVQKLLSVQKLGGVPGNQLLSASTMSHSLSIIINVLCTETLLHFNKISCNNFVSDVSVWCGFKIIPRWLKIHSTECLRPASTASVPGCIAKLHVSITIVILSASNISYLLIWSARIPVVLTVFKALSYLYIHMF